MIVIGLLVPESGSNVLLWCYWSVLTGCLLHLLWILIKNPTPSERPPLLTRDLAMGWAIALPSLITSFWPGVIASPLLTALVGAMWVAEKIRSGSATS